MTQRHILAMSVQAPCHYGNAEDIPTCEKPAKRSFSRPCGSGAQASEFQTSGRERAAPRHMTACRCRQTHKPRSRLAPCLGAQSGFPICLNFTQHPGLCPHFKQVIKRSRRRRHAAIENSMFAAAVMTVHKNLKILVVEPDQSKAKDIIDALVESGWSEVIVIATVTQLDRTLQQQNPDIILIDLANPDRDTLEHISVVSQAKERPVAMFVDRTDEAMTQAAIAAGLSAYVVNGLQMDRIKPVLETAIARFRLLSKMQSELDAAKLALSDRKTIDRAKGLLMRARGLSEDEAYKLMRKTAMDQGRKVIDVATSLVTAADLLQ